MKNFLLKFLGLFIPTINLWRANPALRKQINKQMKNDKEYQSIYNKLLEKIETKHNNELLLKETEKIEHSEKHRKELIETKASSLTTALGISLSLIVLIPAILGTDWGLPKPIALISGISFLLAIIHLLFSAYYSVKVSLVAAIWLTTTDMIEDKFEKSSEDEAKAMIAERLTNIRMNTPVLITKSNYLSVAQKLFLRGIMFLSIGALIALIYQIAS